MTNEQLFKSLDLTNDKYLKEALAAASRGGAAVRKSRPVKFLAVSAACIAAVIACAAIIGSFSENSIPPLSGLFDSVNKLDAPKAGYLRDCKYSAIVDSYISADAEIGFGKFDYLGKTNQDTLNLSTNAAVSTELTVSARISQKYDSYKGREIGFKFSAGIPARLYMFADGSPIEFTYDGVTSLYHDIIIAKTDKEFSFDYLYSVPVSFEAGGRTEQITASVTLLPNYSGIFSDNSYLTRCISVRNLAVKRNYNIYSEKKFDLAYAEFENYQVEANNTLYYFNNLPQIKYSTSYYYPYYIYAMIDGELVKLSDRYYANSPNSFEDYSKFVEPSPLNVEYSSIYLDTTDITKGETHILQLIEVPIILEDEETPQGNSPHEPKKMIFGEKINGGILAMDNTNSDFVVTILGNKTQFIYGEDIRLTAVVSNISSEPITVYCPSRDAGVEVGISLKDWELICRDEYYGQKLAGSSFEIPPGQEYVLDITFDQKINVRGETVTAPYGFYNGVCSVLIENEKGKAQAYSVPFYIQLATFY